jgi:hypothetical protein
MLVVIALAALIVFARRPRVPQAGPALAAVPGVMT